ncbi:MAG TPA: LPS export ABC transporter ATP-binding protein [Candidatus Krumholzibacteria bacterium]|nr:LPS export ABC transporter ATP-binding protein [Candidatus Krumholzibacteria bacterium]
MKTNGNRRAGVLEGRQLTKNYGSRRVVDGIDLQVRSGEIVGLLGPNGAGKTTTFYMLVGMIKPNSGQVLLGEEDVSRLPMYKRARRGLGYLPQEPSVFRRLSVEDNILGILETLHLPRAERTQRMEALLEEMRLTHVRKNRGTQLSGGERRRVEISRALTTDPQFMLLDEPFSGIDPIAVADIQQVVGQLRDRGMGVLITDHNVRETLRITDRAYIMYEGKILLSGTAHDLASDPEARKIYLGERFQL